MNARIKFKQHLQDNQWQYIIVSLIFFLGIILGNYKVLSLEGGVREYLLDLVDSYVKGGAKGVLDGQVIFISAFITQAKTIGLVWFLGLTIIGIPLILGIVCLRGISLGFTLGFLINEKGGAGVWLSILAILPQNMVYITLLIICSVIALNFSVYLFKGRNSVGISLGKGLLIYTGLFAVFLLLSLGGVFMEAYLAPWLLRIFGQ